MTGLLAPSASATQVGAVSVSVNPTRAGTSSTYTVSFTATSVLAAGSGSITFSANSGEAGTQFPPAASSYVITNLSRANGSATVTASPSLANDNSQVTFVTPKKVFAGDSLQVAVSGVVNPPMPTSSQRLSVWTSADTTAVLSAPYAITASPDGSGSLAASPAAVPAGSAATVTLTYTAATGGLLGGAVAIDVPSGWSPPSTTPGAAGYITASAGTVAVAGQRITVSGLDVASNGTITVTYASAVSPPGEATHAFVGHERSTASGTLLPLASAASISTTYAPDGSGAVTASPSSTTALAPTTITFTYTAAAGGMGNGSVALTVPGDWTAPSATAGAAGYTTSDVGAVAVAGRTITISGLTLPANGAVQVTYGAGGGPASVSGSRLGTATFATAQRSTAVGTLTALSTSASVGVNEPTVAISPGAVSSVAGSGQNATVDGVGASASFQEMNGGVAVSGGFAYTATVASVRRTDMASGETTTLAGHPTALGCGDSADPAAVRFGSFTGGAGGAMVTDGVYLYASDPWCAAMRRVSIATGATSTLAGISPYAFLAVGPDGFIYAASGGRTIYRVDPANPTATAWFTFPLVGGFDGAIHGLSADATHVWVSYRQVQCTGTAACPSEELRKVAFADSSTYTVVGSGALGPLTSAGDYLYQRLGNYVRRITKTNGAWVNIAGTVSAGHADGTGADAWFSSIKGVASDGSRLWVADSGNRRLRRITAAAPLPTGQPAPYTTTANVNPGAVSLVAGSGLNATSDGVGASASFQEMHGGVALTGGFAYTATIGSVRRTNVATGETTRLAGHATVLGCADSTDPNAVRFGSFAGGAGGAMVTDGVYLYASDPWCNTMRRVSVATGATSTLAGISPYAFLAVGPDGFIYAASGGRTIYRVDPVNQTATPWFTFPLVSTYDGTIYGVAADATHVWVSYRQVQCTTSGGCPSDELRKVAFADSSTHTVVGSGALGSLTSAGDFLYQRLGNYVRRITKTNGAWVNIAGTTAAGYVEGTGTDAWFNSVTGVASDGSRLWVADSGNRRLRKISAAAPLPTGQPSPYTTTADVSPGAVSSVAGSGQNATLDGVGPSASFQDMYGGVAVSGGFAYTATVGSVRRTDMATGETTRLAGHATALGCGDSADPTAVRFGSFTGGAGGSVVTDGVYLYASDPWCNAMRRVSLATGATSTLTGISPYAFLTVGPDGFVYAASGGRTVYRVDPVNLTATAWFTFPLVGGFDGAIHGLAADATHVWVSYRQVQCTASGGCPSDELRKVAFDTSTYAVVGSGALGKLTSAGDYLYQPLGSYVRRIAKTNGAWVDLLGSSTSGYADGYGSAARLSNISGVASDGRWLWISDSGNRRLRLAAPDPVLVSGGDMMGFDGYGMAEGEDVNGASGNFVTAATDVSIATIGPDLESSRTYNSLDPRRGPVGTGWTFNYDVRADRLAYGAVAILFPDGRREVHKHVTPGVYLAPQGYFSKLHEAPIGGGVTLVAKDGTTYGFAADGKLTSITDENGHQVVLAYGADGKLATATSASGRALHFAWTGARMTSVSTDAVAAHGGVLTWRYYYNGDFLERVCDPRDNTIAGYCTVYAYGSAGKLTKTWNPKGNVEVEVTYQADARVDWRKNGAGDITDVSYPAVRLAHFVDGRTNRTIREYDGFNRLTKQTDALSKSTTYEYDAAGNRSRVVDANNNSSSMSYDARGNLTSVTDGEAKTSYMSYDAKDNKITSADARSSGPTDATHSTRYDYDAAGNPTKETSPPTAAFPEGVAKRWTYTTGAEAAVGGGTMPRGLVRTEVDQRDKVTTKSYDARGDLREVVDPVGQRTAYIYDELGRKTSETQYSDTYPAGVTTTFTYTQLSLPHETTAPATAGVAGGPAHQRRTTKLYDANGNVHTLRDEDLLGGDAARVATYTYDDADREKTVTDPEAGVTSREFDGAGNVIQVADAEGRITVTTYDARNLPTKVTLKDFVDDPVGGSVPRDVVLAEYGYDDARRKTSEKDGLGRVTRFDYDKADRLVKATRVGYLDRDGTVRDIVLSEVLYDAAGHVTREWTGNGGRRVDSAYDAMGRKSSTTFDPAGLNRTTTFVYDAAGNVVSETLTDGTRTEQTRHVYDDGGRRTSSTVENGAEDLTTTYGYDQRDNVTSVTDPRGNAPGADHAAFRATFAYDELSRKVRAVAAPVTIESGGSATIGQPTTETGYTTFGDVERTRDPRGSVTTTTYDRLGRQKGVTHPAYTTPAGTSVVATESFDYDRVGNLTHRVDRRGQATDFTFDKRNRVVRQLDPLASGQASRGETRHSYDDAGNRTATVDQVGARVEWTYDALDRKRTEVSVVRRAGGTDRHTTTFDYDDRNNPTYLQNPAGGTTTQAWSVADELRTVVDAASKTTVHEYDVAGRRSKTTDPLGRASTVGFDLAGRATTASRLAPDGAVLTTTGFGFDQAGNRTAITSARGFTTTFAYDALGRLLSASQPVDATRSTTSSYGYDAAGNRTRVTDGRGHVTTFAFNSWNLAEDTVEPSTAAHPSIDDRRWRATYDAAGQPVRDDQPGGVVVTRSFDELGRLRSESGSGGGAAAASRSFDWDLSGRQTKVSHPDGEISLSYDDRDLLTAVASPSGGSTFAYDEVGRMTSRTDAAGTASFTWTARSELRTATDPITGTTRTYTWDDAGHLDDVSYGAGAATRDYGYDDLGRLSEDRLTTSAGVTTEREVYGYDGDDNVTSQLVELAGNGGAGQSTYGYDRAGRLASWTKPDGSVVSYGWDDAGNRTSAGASTYGYDERNRMMSGPDGVYGWSARGTLASVTGGSGAVAYGFDALGRLVDYNGGVAYSYDGLGRVARRGGVAFSYGGVELDPVTDGTSTYSRSPGGDLLALQSGSTSGLVGRNRHGDVTHLFGASGAVSSTRTFDPFGGVVAAAGYVPDVGFQGDWTDPASGKVWMGARWYDAKDAGFASRDTVLGDPTSGVSLNRYTYAFADPLDYFDPDGRWPSWLGKAAQRVKRSVVGRAAGRFVLPPASVRAASAVVAETVGSQVRRGQHKLGELRRAEGQARGFVGRRARDFGGGFVKSVRGMAGAPKALAAESSFAKAGRLHRAWQKGGVEGLADQGGAELKRTGQMLGGVAQSLYVAGIQKNPLSPYWAMRFHNDGFEATAKEFAAFAGEQTPEALLTIASAGAGKVAILRRGATKLDDAAAAASAPQTADDLARAAAARDAAGQQLGRKHATYAGGTKDGRVVIGCSTNPIGCAEDDIARQLGPNAQMTEAFGWRRSPTTGQLEWTEIPVCTRCQGSYGPNQFPPDVQAEPGGAWGRR